MKANSFQVKYALVKQFLNKVIVPVSVVGLIGGFYFGSTIGIVLAIVLLVLTLLANCIWFVSSETAGVKRVFGKIAEESYDDRTFYGMRFKVPGITETQLLNIQPQTRVFTDVKKSVGRNVITIEGSFCYTLNKRYVHLLLKLLGENFYEEHLYRWMDSIFDSVVSQLSYPHFQATKQEVEEWCSRIIAGRIARECSSRTQNEVPTGVVFNSTYCELIPIINTSVDSTTGALVSTPQLKPVPVGEDRIEMVPEFILQETPEVLPGVNLFENISLKINKVDFEKTYEEAQQNVAIAKAKVAEELEKRKKTLVTLQTQQDIIEKKAESEAKAILAKAKAEAEAMSRKGASENEIKEKFAEICMNNPKYLDALMRLNMPKVLTVGGNSNGGATPMFDIDKLISSSGE